MTGDPPQIMGIVNRTPDSFSDGGRFVPLDHAIDHALALIADGADILDIGGESTRPGAASVPEQEEIDRTAPLVEALAARSETPISIDTRKPGVARAAFAAGATIWNDVSALTFAETSLQTAASLAGPVILMHASGDPETMQDDPQYEDVVREVAEFLAARRDAAIAAGVERRNIYVDPGIGFGKTLAHNLALLANLGQFATIAPVLLGASRKRFIAAIDRDGPADDSRLGGSLAAALAGAAQGAAVLRVHDVAAMRQALAVHTAIAQSVD